MLAEQTMSDGFQDLKVMVIDDSKTIRRTAETLLKKAGCEVFTATDGFEALSKLAFDILQTLRRLREVLLQILNNQIHYPVHPCHLQTKD